MGTNIFVAFISPESGAVGEPPRSGERFHTIIESVKGKLSEMYQDINFSYFEIEDESDVSEFLKNKENCDGYLVIVLNCIRGLVRPILHSGKPVVLINETYGGSGEYLLEYSQALENSLPVIGLSTEKVASEKALENVNFLDVVSKLRDSKSLFVVSPGVKQQIESEYPISVDLWSVVRTIWTKTGIEPNFIGSEEFLENYIKKVDDEKAQELMEKWIKNAEEVKESDEEAIKNSARLYFALKSAAEDYEVDSIAVDCIVLQRNEFLEAWPCLAFMELYKEDDVVPVCEADPYSNVSMLIMKYLADLPGFINDPCPEDFSNKMIYYHCYAPINFNDTESGCLNYKISPAHLDGKHASVYTEFPEEGKITVVGLDPENSIITLHKADIIGNEESEHSCSTKLVAEANAQKISENWRSRTGWHRVAFYGDWVEEFKKIGRLTGLEIEREDL